MFDVVREVVMTPELMKARTKGLGVAVVKLSEQVRPTPAGRVVMNQLIRGGTSVGTNYRAARRSRSRREFVSRRGVVIEEADEVMYWLELAVETGMVDREAARPVWSEACEVLKMLVSTIQGVRRRSARGPQPLDTGAGPVPTDIRHPTSDI